MKLYLILFALVALAALLESYMTAQSNDLFYISNQRKVINIIVLVVLVLVSGTRLVGGTDFYWYENAYKAIPTVGDVIHNTSAITGNFWISGMDIGYLFITAVIKSFGINFHGYCLIQSAFFCFAMYKGLSRYCNNFSIVLLVFLAKIFFYDTFISMRQSITIAIFFLALPLIEQRKLVKYMIISILCITIHGGALIMIPVYFITYIPMTRKIFEIIIAIFAPFAVLNILNVNYLGILAPLISRVFGLISSSWSTKVTNYFATEEPGMSLFYVLEFLLLAFLVYENSELLFKDSKCTFVIRLFLITWMLLTLFGGISVITREKDYFILSYGLILCYSLRLNTKKYRQIIIFGTIAICLFEYLRYLTLFDNGSLLEYSSWLFR